MGAGTAAANTCRSRAAPRSRWFAAPIVDRVGAFRANRTGLPGALDAEVVRQRRNLAAATDGNQPACGAEDVSSPGLSARRHDQARTGRGKYAQHSSGSSGRYIGPSSLRSPADALLADSRGGAKRIWQGPGGNVPEF